MSKSSNRQLAVILFADISGYTALMQDNESKALNTIHRFKSIVDKCVSQCDGRVIHYHGDGCLISFRSSTESVKCALRMQSLFQAEEDIPVRIGIHQGDVVFEGNTAYGDGVNVSSRIESIAEPGSILISKPIRNQIKNKKEFKLHSLGLFEFKNVNEPVEVFAIANKGLTVPKRKDLRGKLKVQKPSFLHKRPVQIGAVILNLVVAVLSMVYFLNYVNTDEGLIVNSGNKYVLAIGVDNNPNWRKLYNAKNDALGVIDVLKRYFGFKEITDPLINEGASKSQILTSIEQAKEVLKEDDQLVVFYAGHGYSDAVDGSDDPEGYIVPFDAPGEESKDPSGFIKISDFLKKISSLPALHITTIFDACYSGFALKDQILVSRGSNKGLSEAAGILSRKVFSSADHDEQAADNGPIAEHSLFTGYLIEGLRTGQADNNGDKVISMNEMAIFLERNIGSFRDSKQTPRYGSYKDDEGGEMLLEYENPLSRKSSNINELLKDKDKEIYAAVPFRTSTGSNIHSELKTFLPEMVLESLSEFDRKKFKVANPNFMTLSDSATSIMRPQDILKGLESTKYFAGRYEIFGNEIVVKVSLHNSDDDQFIYSFPDIIGSFSDDYSLRNLALEIKKRIKGFMDNNGLVMDRLTTPPNYEAYKELKRAYAIICENREEGMKYIDRALEIDPKYFRAHLLKAFSYVNCTPVNVGKALEEWNKFKDIEFELTDFEQERFVHLEDELRGNYQALVQPKFELFKEYGTRKVFNDAMFYVLITKNVSLAKKMIKMAESKEIDPDFKNDIFVTKNWMELYLLDNEMPKYYARFSLEEELIKQPKYFRYFLPSKLLHDCQNNCVESIRETLKKYNQDKWWRYIESGKIMEFKGEETKASKLYNIALNQLNSKEKVYSAGLIEAEYRLHNYERCVEIGEKNLSKWLESKSYSPVRYYILAKISLGKPILKLEEMLDTILSYDRFPGWGAYYLATIKCKQEKYGEALDLLVNALENGVGFTTSRYNFDPDLKPLWAHPEFIAFTKPK